MSKLKAQIGTYTHEEREVMLKKMTEAKDNFYLMAVQIGVHPFIEFAGFIGEYIKCCKDMHDQGLDFGTEELVIQPQHAAYLGEKLDCIYGEALTDRENLKSFLAYLS